MAAGWREPAGGGGGGPPGGGGGGAPPEGGGGAAEFTAANASPPFNPRVRIKRKNDLLLQNDLLYNINRTDRVE